MLFPPSGVELIWTKVGEPKRSFSLGDCIREFARITWPKALSNRAVGERAGGRVIIEAKGIVHPVMAVTGEALDQEIARMPWTWRKETRIDFVDGRSFVTRKHGFWNLLLTFPQEDRAQSWSSNRRGFCISAERSKWGGRRESSAT
jgi:hypothetical protein